MPLPRLAIAALLGMVLSIGAAAQDARAIVAEASRAMGADTLTSLTYSGTAANGNFGQRRNIGGPLQMTAITAYTCAIDFSQPASRASGPTLPPAVPGQPANPALAALLANTERLKIDFDRHVPVHALNPDRLLSRAELAASQPR